MRVVVASTRPAKIHAARAALDAIGAIDAGFGGATLETIDVGAAAPAMPLSDRETLEGARARALAALAVVDRPAGGETVLALGLEGGIAPLPIAAGEVSAHALVSWAAATDGSTWGYGSGGGILLPDGVAGEVLSGRELGDVIDRLAGAPVRGTRGAWGVLTRDLVGRRDAYTIAALAALAPFYNTSVFTTTRR